MEKSCWLARLANQQLFPIQILLIFLRFELPPNFIFQCYRPQTWQFYLFFPALFISGTYKVSGLKFKGGQVHLRRPGSAKGQFFQHNSCIGLRRRVQAIMITIQNNLKTAPSHQSTSYIVLLWYPEITQTHFHLESFSVVETPMAKIKWI